MIGKLTGNGGVAAKVAKAKDDYESGDIDGYTYIDRLNEALDKLDAYDAQLEEKIDSGKILDSEASALLEKSAIMWTSIINLISIAMP